MPACHAGLCCAALLARYGYSVTVCEAHYHAGGAAHAFEVQGYKFDSGPSFFAGLSGNQITVLPLVWILFRVMPTLTQWHGNARQRSPCVGAHMTSPIAPSLPGIKS